MANQTFSKELTHTHKIPAYNDYVILIAEDDHITNKIIQKRLSAFDYPLLTAYTGKEAIKKYAMYPNTILLLDYSLPDMTGFELVQELQRLYENIHFAVLTGSESQQLAVDLMKLGAKDFLYKSADSLEMLPQIIDRIIKEIEAEKKLKQALYALKQSEEEKKMILDNISETLIYFDTNYTVVWANNAAEKTYQKPLSEIIYNKCYEITYNTHKPCENCHIRTCMEQKKVYESEKEIHSRHYLVRSNPIFTADNQVFGIIQSIIDITEKKIAESALLESKEMIRKIFDSSPDAITVIDRNGTIIDCNQATEHLHEYSRDELIGSTFFNLVDPKYHNKAILNEARVVKYGSLKNQEFIMLRKYSKPFYAEISTSIVLNSGCQSNPFICITKDITERKRAELYQKKAHEELERRVQERTHEIESFTYSVSHDLRAPLRAVDGYSKFLLQDYQDVLDEEGRDLLAIIRENTQKMDKLIDGLLALSRVGRQDIELNHVQMSSLIQTALEDRMNVVPYQNNVTFEINNLPDTFGDASMLQQVWHNLISNSIKFTSKSEKPMIKIGGRTRPDYSLFYIKDNGTGFSMEYVDKLFGVFQRLHDAKDYDGHGIGLALIKRIILRHKGRIKAKGKEGQGALFAFILPHHKSGIRK